MKKPIYIFGLFMFSLFGCYSFTGSSLSPEVKTIQIKNFPNKASLINPDLSQQFSVDLQNRFLQRTNLKGTNENPDILIEGNITDYKIMPTSISSSGIPGGVTAAQNKLTITVNVHYENKVEPNKNFDRTFSDEVLFDSNLSIQNIESSQVKLVNEKIIDKILMIL